MHFFKIGTFIYKVDYFLVIKTGEGDNMLLLNKKGDSGLVAAFIFLFAALLIIYMLLLPADERDELLDLDGDGINGSDGGSSSVLLDVSPGFVDSVGRSDYEYSVPNIRIVSNAGAKVIKEENAFVVRNSWLSKKGRDIEFEVGADDKVDNLVLSFNAPVRRGALVVKLNGDVVYENEVSQFSAEPVRLPAEKVKRGVNVVSVLPSSVGARFWGANQYSLENVKIIGDVTDVSGQKSSAVFFIPDTRSNINAASLKFIPECVSSGGLVVLLNGNELFSGVPECKVLNSVIVPPDFLVSGVNKLEYSSDVTYLIDLIKVKTSLKEKRQPKYYFFIDDDQWKKISGSSYSANLSMQFLVPEDDYVDFKVTVNNRDIGVDQREEFFEVSLDDYLLKGNNVVRVTAPDSSVDIISMKIAIKKIKK
jgi:hypothetical protein